VAVQFIFRPVGSKPPEVIIFRIARSGHRSTLRAQSRLGRPTLCGRFVAPYCADGRSEPCFPSLRIGDWRADPP